jgi:hypothetical protein
MPQNKAGKTEMKKYSFTLEEWDRAIKLADEHMKESNGHYFVHILKTRCQYCGKSEKVKTRCGGWFNTYMNRLIEVFLNNEHN